MLHGGCGSIGRETMRPECWERRKNAQSWELVVRGGGGAKVAESWNKVGRKW